MGHIWDDLGKVLDQEEHHRAWVPDVADVRDRDLAALSTALDRGSANDASVGNCTGTAGVSALSGDALYDSGIPWHEQLRRANLQDQGWNRQNATRIGP